MTDVHLPRQDSLVDADTLRDTTIRSAIMSILEALGYDLSDQHFQKTPERAAAMFQEFASPTSDPGAHLDVQFADEHDSLVLVGGIEYTSFCAHHLLPVIGKAHVGYIPNQRVTGLSKLARVVQAYSRQFSVQERVTQLIANCIDTKLQTKGTIVVIEATHGCMTMRGVRQHGTLTSTSAVRGVFKTNDGGCKDEFFELLKRQGHARAA